jgi:hypothetical protein
MKKEKDKIRIDKAINNLPEVKEILCGIPHPVESMASKGFTLADYVEWMFQNAGNSGKIKTCRIVESF